jgi:hypothetical protein
MSKGIFESLTAVDPEAIWLQMGWLFIASPGRWTPERVEAYLAAVPQGRMIILDYEGDFKDDKRHGKGVYTFAGIGRYHGDFLDGQGTGKGEWQYLDGRHYVGDVVRNRHHGYGVMEYPDGSRYEGQWQNDKCNGQGKLTYGDGRVFEGQFLDDEPVMDGAGDGT